MHGVLEVFRGGGVVRARYHGIRNSESPPGKSCISETCESRRGLESVSDQQESPSSEQLLRRNVRRFRGGLVVEAHRLVYHSTLGWRVTKKKKTSGIVFHNSTLVAWILTPDLIPELIKSRAGVASRHTLSRRHTPTRFGRGVRKARQGRELRMLAPADHTNIGFSSDLTPDLIVELTKSFCLSRGGQPTHTFAAFSEKERQMWMDCAQLFCTVLLLSFYLLLPLLYIIFFFFISYPSSSLYHIVLLLYIIFSFFISYSSYYLFRPIPDNCLSRQPPANVLLLNDPQT